MIKIEEIDENNVKLFPSSYLGNKFWEFKDAIAKHNARYVTSDGSKYNVLPYSKLPNAVEDIEKVLPVEMDEVVSHKLFLLQNQQVFELNEIEEGIKAADKRLSQRGLSIRDYQKEDIKRIYGEKNIMLCNPVGTGKTMTSLHSIPSDYKVIIISPSGVRYNWKDELQKWGLAKEQDIYISTSRQKEYYLEKKYTILTYSTLPPEETLNKITLQPNTAIILDEVHLIKNSKAIRTKRAKALIDKVNTAGGMIIGLTATPLLNKEMELFSLLKGLHLINRSFGNWNGFTRAFGGYQGRFGWEFTGPKPEVHEILKKVMIKRPRKDIIDELPDYTHEIVPVTINKKALKEAAEAVAHLSDNPEEVIEQALDLPGSTAFQALARCRSILAQAKAVEIVELLETYIEAEESVVVTCNSSRAIEALAERLPSGSYGVVTGKVDSRTREDVRKRFMASEFPLLLVTQGSSFQGVDFTRASHMIFIDQDFRPGINYQMRGRIDRLTQTKKALVYKYIVSQHPIDILTHQILQRKEKLLEGTFQDAVY